MYKKKTKVAIVIILVLIMAIPLFSMNAFAAEALPINRTMALRPSLQNEEIPRQLNVTGNNTIGQNVNVMLWGTPVTTAQKWKFQVGPDGYYRLHSMINTAYALNVYRYQGANYMNCDVMRWETNRHDSVLTSYTNWGMYISLRNYSAYKLVATGKQNWSNVKWSNASSGFVTAAWHVHDFY